MRWKSAALVEEMSRAFPGSHFQELEQVLALRAAQLALETCADAPARPLERW